MPKRGHGKHHQAFGKRDLLKNLKRQQREAGFLPCEFCGKDVDGREEAVMNTETRQFAHRRCAEEHVAKLKEQEAIPPPVTQQVDRGKVASVIFNQVYGSDSKKE